VTGHNHFFRDEFEPVGCWLQQPSSPNHIRPTSSLNCGSDFALCDREIRNGNEQTDNFEENYGQRNDKRVYEGVNRET